MKYYYHMKGEILSRLDAIGNMHRFALGLGCAWNLLNGKIVFTIGINLTCSGDRSMFCPNCGAENRVEQNFCRSCGLKLDAISQAVADQFPSKEYAALQRRKELLEKLGLFSLSGAGLIGLGFLLFKVAYFKLILFGPDVLFWSSAIALIGFLLLSVFFFNYPKLFMKFEKLNPRLSPPDESTIATSTNKLIEDRPFEPVPSVTEHSTELLHTPEKIRSSK